MHVTHVVVYYYTACHARSAWSHAGSFLITPIQLFAKCTASWRRFSVGLLWCAKRTIRPTRPSFRLRLWRACTGRRLLSDSTPPGSSAISSSFTCSDNRNGYVGRRPDKSSWIKIAPRLFIAPWCPDIHESDKSDLYKLIYISHIFSVR